MHGIVALQQNSAAVISLLCLQTQKQKTCLESCIIHFQTTPACSTTVDVLETGDVPILFWLPQMRNLGVTIELDPQGDKITCPALACFLLQLSIPQWDIFVGPDESHVSAYD